MLRGCRSFVPVAVGWQRFCFATGVNLNQKPFESAAVARIKSRPRLSTSYYSLMKDSSIRIMPPIAERGRKSFHWGYVLGQALRRLDPRSYF